MAQGKQQISFDEAVERSRTFLASWASGNGGGLSAGRNLTHTQDWEAMRSEVSGATMLRKKPTELVKWAEEDARGFDALRLGIAHALTRGFDEEITPEVRTWLVQYLRGETTRPNAKGDGHRSEGLHIGIYLAVQMLVDSYGLTATRNDASDETSACDAVANALAQLDMPPKTPKTFTSVKRVYLNMSDRTSPGIPAT